MYIVFIRETREARGTQVENDLMDSLQTTRYISIIETAAMTRGNHTGKTSLSKKKMWTFYQFHVKIRYPKYVILR